MPVRRRFTRQLDGKGSHQRLDSYDPPLPQLHHEASKSSFSTKASPRNRLRGSRSHLSNNSDDGHPPVYHPLNSGLAIDDLPIGVPEPDRDMQGFVDRFRQLIHQVTRETEEGLAFARSETSSSHSTARSRSPRHDNEYIGYTENHYDNGGTEDDFYGTANAQIRPLDTRDYSEQQAYPEDEHVRMMNGYVKRMPTIESMGSKELGDSLGGGSRASGQWRPPTRNTMWSFPGAASEAGSEPRTRPNSFSLQAQADSLMVGMFGRANASEIGELMRSGDTIRMVGGVAAIPASDDSSDALGGSDVERAYASGTAGTAGSKGSSNSGESQVSVGMASFHTASLGSASTMSIRTKLADATESSLPLPTQAESSLLPYRQGFGRRSADIQRPPVDG